MLEYTAALYAEIAETRNALLASRKAADDLTAVNSHLLRERSILSDEHREYVAAAKATIAEDTETVSMLERCMRVQTARIEQSATQFEQMTDQIAQQSAKIARLEETVRIQKEVIEASEGARVHGLIGALVTPDGVIAERDAAASAEEGGGAVAARCRSSRGSSFSSAAPADSLVRCQSATLLMMSCAAPMPAASSSSSGGAGAVAENHAACKAYYDAEAAAAWFARPVPASEDCME